MLAFSKNIAQKDLLHPQEEQDTRLKDYMDYQRRLNNVRIASHALKYAKNNLEHTLDGCRKKQEDPASQVQLLFPFSHCLAEPKTLLLMLKKLIQGQNDPGNWYRMNAYYHAMVFDCLKTFLEFYNGLVDERSEKVGDYTIAQGQRIDFNDWVFLFFPDLDFHIGKDLGYKQYPFASRNKAIEEELEKKSQQGKTLREALKEIQKDFEIDDCSIRVLTSRKISTEDLEMFHTSMDNAIYEFVTHKMEGSWDSIDGESLLDQAFALGAQLKVTVWKRRRKKQGDPPRK